MKKYTEEYKDTTVIMAEPEAYSPETLNDLLDAVGKTKIEFSPEVKVRTKDNKNVYIGEIRKVRNIYMVKVEFGDDSALRQVKDLDSDTIRSIINRLKIILKK